MKKKSLTEKTMAGKYSMTRKRGAGFVFYAAAADTGNEPA
jgi:hypothetical protein